MSIPARYRFERWLARVLRRGTVLDRRRHLDRLRRRGDLERIDPRSLLFFFDDVHSQRGQDGILAEIFRRLAIGTGEFVEFGAWDGVRLSNCRALYERGWRGVFVEAEGTRYEKLRRVYAGASDVVTIHATVGAPGRGVAGEPLARLLEAHGVAPACVTFVSIDVDGPDLEIFSELGLSPPVVLLEGGFSLSPYLEQRAPDEIAWNNIQQPLPIIVETARRAGYRPVGFCQDTYLVRSDLAGPFAECARDAVSLYRDAFHFVPDAFRRELIEFRRSSGPIRRLESRYFGYFSPDPLGYAYRPRTM